jgi:dienelactone hydrolase
MTRATLTRTGLLAGVVFTLSLLGSRPALAQTGSPTPTLAQLLAYRAEAPLEVKLVSSKRETGVIIDDITFASVAGGAPVAAYLVRPDGAAKSAAGVLFVHWFEPSSPTSNRTQFLDEARELAKRGTVSLLVATFWSDPARYRARRWQDDYQNTINQAKDLRRALDVLLIQPGVDAQRIACVGHDYGAMFGSLAVAADTRVKAFVSIAGTVRFADWYTFGSASGRPAGAELTDFRARLAPLDPINALPLSKAAVFFQFGETDHYTPRPDFVALYLAAREPKRLATYASDHPMLLPVIRYDRHVWLREQLGLPEPVAAK